MTPSPCLDPYAKANHQKLSDSVVPVVSQSSQDSEASQHRQNNTKKRKFVPNPYHSAKKAPAPPKIEFNEFDDGLEEKLLLLALLSAERKRRVAAVLPKTAAVAQVQNKSAKGNENIKTLTRGARARKCAAHSAQQHAPSKVKFEPNVAPASKEAWDVWPHPHRVTPQKAKNPPPYELDDEFDDDIDEDSLVAALEAAEKKRSTRIARVVAPAASAQKMRPPAISPDYKTSQMPNECLKHNAKFRHDADNESIDELKPASQARSPTNTFAVIRGPRGPSSCVMEACVPRSLFATNLKIPTTNHPDDIFALTMDPIVSSQGDNDDENIGKDPADKTLKLHLISMSTALEKILKRKFTHYCRPTDSLMDCIDRLRRKGMIPSDLANSMSDIRWLGHMAGHRPKFPVKRSEIDEIIRQYQNLRADNSKRL